MRKKLKYKICNFCIMDTSDEDIVFDTNGRCNHCKSFENTLKSPRYDKKNSTQKLNSLIRQLRNSKKKYDCLIGISGGVDSCYTAYLCKKWGLNPLIMHMDNGWNSDIRARRMAVSVHPFSSLRPRASAVRGPLTAKKFQCLEDERSRGYL